MLPPCTFPRRLKYHEDLQKIFAVIGRQNYAGTTMSAAADNDINAFHTQLCRYRTAEELFGPLEEETLEERLEELKRRYKEFQKKYHPDRHASGDALTRYLAGQIASAINEFHAIALERIKQGVYGKPERALEVVSVWFEIETRLRKYRVFEKMVQTDHADIYSAACDGDDGVPERVVIKIMRDTADNDLLLNEAGVLRLLQHKSLPTFIESFKTTDGEAALVTRAIDGYDLETVREKYPDGVPQEHMVWMLDRLLSVLGYLHINRVIHGNIEPGNIMVRPRDHNVYLIDYLFAVVDPGASRETIQGCTEGFAAPEVFQKKLPIPPMDIYALGKSMVFLLGGDIETNKIPSKVDKRIRDFLLRFLEPDPMKRTRNAWEAWHKLSELRLAVFGARNQFLEFTI